MPGDFASAVLAEATQRGRARPAAGPRRHRHPVRHHRPAGQPRPRPGAAHRPRRRRLTSSATRSPTSPRSSRRAARSTRRRTGAARRSTSPTLRVPLHPPALSEGAASLLPGQVRPAVLWRIDLGVRRCASTSSDVDARAGAQHRAARLRRRAGRARRAAALPDPIAALPDVGERAARAGARPARDQPRPARAARRAGRRGGWTLALRAALPVERYNAEISLLTGMCAATHHARPAASASCAPCRRPTSAPSTRCAARRARSASRGRTARSPATCSTRVDRSNPQHVAFLEHAVALLRGAGYTPFDGAAARRSRCTAASARRTRTSPHRCAGSSTATAARSASRCTPGTPVPDWVRAALPALPDEMQRADQLAHDGRPRRRRRDRGVAAARPGRQPFRRRRHRRRRARRHGRARRARRARPLRRRPTCRSASASRSRLDRRADVATRDGALRAR